MSGLSVPSNVRVSSHDIHLSEAIVHGVVLSSAPSSGSEVLSVTSNGKSEMGKSPTLKESESGSSEDSVMSSEEESIGVDSSSVCGGADSLSPVVVDVSSSSVVVGGSSSHPGSSRSNVPVVVSGVSSDEGVSLSEGDSLLSVSELEGINTVSVSSGDLVDSVSVNVKGSSVHVGSVLVIEGSDSEGVDS